MEAKDLTDGAEPMTHAEVKYLHKLAASLPGGPVIVNIGAADGVSTAALLEIVQGTGGFIFSVDTGPCELEFENLRKLGLDAERVVRLLGRSQDIGLCFPYVCEMVYVDGDHRWNGIIGDLEVWPQKVAPRGILAFHDYIEEPPANNVTDVWSAVNTALLDDPGWEKLGVVDRIIAFRRKSRGRIRYGCRGCHWGRQLTRY